MTRYARLATPVGSLVLAGDDVLSGIWFEPHRGVDPVAAGWRRDEDAFVDARAQLAEWFAGDRRTFELALGPLGTAFQLRVWDALVAIPYGHTRTYADMASSLGTSARAVGHANARNPLSIVVPCHRLVGAAGLTGYAGGLDAKRWLLDHERRVAGIVGDSSLQP